MADREHNGTEAPTPRRREHARNEGQVVYSTDLTAAASLLTGTLLLLLTGPAIARVLLDAVRTWVTGAPTDHWTDWHSTGGARWLSAELLQACGLLTAALIVTGLLLALLQVGFVVSTKPLQVNFEKLLPSRGWDRVFSVESGVRGLLGSIKVTVLLGIALLYAWAERSQLQFGRFATVADAAAAGWWLSLRICLAMAGLLAGLAVVDYIVKWARNEKKLRMTREELKQEQREDTGDPHLRAAVRKKQRERLKQQSMRDVPEATIVLTNPTHIAVALKYEPGQMPAPRVIAKGAGVFAANIVRIARRHGIPVYERKPLARALFRSVSVGREIPLEFFRAVAEILAELYRHRRAA